MLKDLPSNLMFYRQFPKYIQHKGGRKATFRWGGLFSVYM